MPDFMYKTAKELARLIREGKATSVDVTKAHLDQIKKHNDKLNAVIIHTEEKALETAKECDQEAKEGNFRGPLHGVPMTIKEQFWLEGEKGTMNFNQYKDFIAPEDALIVDRLKKAGAVIMGKTNVPRKLLDYQVWGDIYPEGKNPYDLEYSPGGSSGGSAAALVSGMTPIELGGDFGGSIRIPSYFCGLPGLKPTEYTIPNHGLVPQLESEKGHVFEMAVAGPMARTVDDMELVWKVIRGSHHSDRTTPRIDWHEPVGTKLNDYKVAWVDKWPDYEPSEEIRTLIREFVEMLSTQGCKTENNPPGNDIHRRSLSFWMRLSGIVLSQDVPWFIRPLMKWDMKRTVFKRLKKFKKEFNKGFKQSFINYSETMGIRAEIVGEWEQYFEEYDLLVCPMSFGPAYKRCKIGSELSYEGKSMIYSEYSWPYVSCFNASGNPAMNIPLGLNKNGLPVGVQAVGPYWSEPSMIQFAKLISDYTPGFLRPEGY